MTFDLSSKHDYNTVTCMQRLVISISEEKCTKMHFFTLERVRAIPSDKGSVSLNKLYFFSKIPNGFGGGKGYDEV